MYTYLLHLENERKTHRYFEIQDIQMTITQMEIAWIIYHYGHVN